MNTSIVTKDQVKLVILGNSGVGKTSIVNRFVTDAHDENTDATVGATFISKIIQAHDRTLRFQIWDTAGQERYRALAKMYYNDAQAAVLVYDITNASSFDGLKKWYNELADNGPNGCQIAVVGNKEDLVENEQVDQTEAKEFASSIGALYQKTSAKTSFGIENLFIDLAQKVNPAKVSNRRESVTVNKQRKQSSSKSMKRKCC